MQKYQSEGLSPPKPGVGERKACPIDAIICLPAKYNPMAEMCTLAFQSLAFYL